MNAEYKINNAEYEVKYEVSDVVDVVSDKVTEISEETKINANNIESLIISTARNSNDIDNLRISVADSIYARRCDEHVMVLKDCPKNIRGGFGAFLYKLGHKGRYIPPYCCQWCDLMNKPTASLKG